MEAEVEAEPDRLREAIDLIPELASKLPASAGAPSAQPVTGAQAEFPVAEKLEPGRFPLVALVKSDSLSDVIEKFFSDPWGRERRKLSDVREVLQSYGLSYPKQSVAVALLRLAKSTRIRRFKAGDGEFVYTSTGVSHPQPSMPLITTERYELASPRQN